MEVPGIGPGESYTGLTRRSVQLNSNGQKDPEQARMVVFIGGGGPGDHMMPHHYRAHVIF